MNDGTSRGAVLLVVPADATAGRALVNDGGVWKSEIVRLLAA
jgi:hypothetical protein